MIEYTKEVDDVSLFKVTRKSKNLASRHVACQKIQEVPTSDIATSRKISKSGSPRYLAKRKLHESYHSDMARIDVVMTRGSDKAR